MSKEHIDIIKEPNVQFIELETGIVLLDIWRILQSGIWKNANVENFEYNNLKGVLKRNDWKTIFEGITPVYPGMILNNKTKKLEDPTYTPKCLAANWETVVETAQAFFNRFEKKKNRSTIERGFRFKYYHWHTSLFKNSFLLGRYDYQ